MGLTLSSQVSLRRRIKRDKVKPICQQDIDLTLDTKALHFIELDINESIHARNCSVREIVTFRLKLRVSY